MTDTVKYKNVISINNFNVCGGVETFIYYMAKLYSESHDIVVFYKTGSQAQVERLKKLVRVVKNVGQEIECELLIMNYDIEVMRQVKADKYIQVVHADYERQKIKPRTDDRIDEYVAVSKVVADAWKRLTGITCKVIPNPLCLDKPKRVLHLISATRLSPEKGKDRMKMLGDLLDKAEIPYTWTVYTDAKEPFNNPNFITLPPRLDILDMIADADYLVQLSDCEGACYSVIEALSLGTPVIVTDIPTFREQGVRDGENGYLLPLDMKDIDIKKIYEEIPKFFYRRTQTKWSDALVPGKSDYLEEISRRFLVEATDEYLKRSVVDNELGRVPQPGERFTVGMERLKRLMGDNPYKKEFVKFIEEVKKE